MKVMYICENHTHDRYIVEPILAQVLKQAGVVRSAQSTYQGTFIRSVSQLLKLKHLKDVTEEFPGVDVFVVVADNDGDPKRVTSITDLLKALNEVLEKRAKKAFGILCMQELEAWALAGVDPNDRQVDCQRLRSEVSCKEVHFETYVKRKELSAGPGEGRKHLGAQAAAQFNRVKACCVELETLISEVRNWYQGRTAGAST